MHQKTSVIVPGDLVGFCGQRISLINGDLDNVWVSSFVYLIAVVVANLEHEEFSALIVSSSIKREFSVFSRQEPKIIVVRALGVTPRIMPEFERDNPKTYNQAIIDDAMTIRYRIANNPIGAMIDPGFVNDVPFNKDAFSSETHDFGRTFMRLV